MGKGRRDRTPAVKVTAQGSKRVSVAALITAKPGVRGGHWHFRPHETSAQPLS